MTDSRRPESSGQTVVPANVLDVGRLSVRFGTPVLTELAFQVRHGTSLAIIGPNGAGKSILLKALIG